MRRQAILVDKDIEGRRTDRTGERPGERHARCGDHRRHDETQWRRRGLGDGPMAHQENRATGRKRPPVKSAGGRQVQPSGIAPQLEQDGPGRIEAGSFLRDPQQIGEPCGLGDEKLARTDAEGRRDARQVGLSRLAQHLGTRNPYDRTSARRLRREGERCTRNRAGIPREAAMDLRQPRCRNAATENDVKAFDAGWHMGEHRNTATTGQHDSLGAVAILARNLKRLRQPAFDPRNVPTQGVNDLARRGELCHGTCFRQMFLFCSYRFRSQAEESSDGRRIYS